MPYKECPQCGRLFYVPDPALWAYKSHYRRNGIDIVEFLHTWSCYLKYEKDHGIKRYGNRDGSLFDGIEDDKEENFRDTERVYHKRKDTKTRRADYV